MPDLLLGFGLDSEFARLHIRNRAPQPVVRLTAVQGLLHALPEQRIVDEGEDVERPADRVQLPERLLGLVLARVGTQLADDRRLRYILLCQRGQDALDIRPFLDDDSLQGLASWLDQGIAVVARLVRADQTFRL